MNKSISDLIMDYFKKHPNKDLKHGPVVDWVTNQYLMKHKSPPRDPWRAIRLLHQKGKLVKVKKGVYRYNPKHTLVKEIFEFSLEMKEEIFKRDNFKCVVCGRGHKDGVEICADHRIPKDKGGTNTVDNGQTLCTEHNLLKKNYSLTEAGKRYFIKIYNDAKEKEDFKMVNFCEDIFDVYDDHSIDTHILRPNKK